jgi:hypothetical protein
MNLEFPESSTEPKQGTILQFDIPSRFRWLTALRSLPFNLKTPSGLCDDLEQFKACLKIWYCND